MSGGVMNGGLALPRGVIVLLGLASVVVSVAGLRSVSDILGPVVLALMPAAALMATVYVVLGGLAVALVLSVTRLVELMPQYQAQFTQWSRRAAGTRWIGALISAETTPSG